MQNVAHIQETELSENELYEVIDEERTGAADPEIIRLREELDTERERGIRLLAEFDNYRRRTRQEQALAGQNGKREVLLALLEVLDDFDRALLHIGEAPSAVAEGLRLIRQRFGDVLHSNGVTPFDSEGKPFDPTVHEAITVIDSDGEASGTVYTEHRRGYLINGALLRPARVAVLK
ncbi:MAG TPA: nucleotide exchange factor GrpE [Pyrinomonadaceae bacterium]|nr:nucleotide exchange factor GrpE [Pyrinomonadaceae bacterium]